MLKSRAAAAAVVAKVEKTPATRSGCIRWPCLTRKLLVTIITKLHNEKFLIPSRAEWANRQWVAVAVVSNFGQTR